MCLSVYIPCPCGMRAAELLPGGWQLLAFFSVSITLFTNNKTFNNTIVFNKYARVNFKSSADKA